MTQPVLLSPRLERIEKVISFPDLELLDLTRDGTTALLLSSRSGSYQLETLDISTGKTRPASSGNERVSYARVSTDSKRIAFSRDIGEREAHQLYTYNLGSTSKEEQLTHLPPTRLENFEWSHKDDRLAVAGATSEYNGIWTIDSTSGDASNIYKGKHWLVAPSWSRDDSRICFSAKTTDSPTTMELVFKHSDGTGEPRVYTPKPGSENIIGGWSPVDERVLFKTDTRGRYELAIYQPDTGQLDYLKAGEQGLDFPVYSWTPDGKSVYYLAAREGRTRLFIEPADMSSQPRQIPIPEGFHAGFSGSSVKMDQTGQFFIFSYSSLSKPPVVFACELDEMRLRPIYDYRLTLPLGRAEHIVYNSFDQRPIHGWFLKPPSVSGARPCVLWIHGGPAWEVADAWNPAIQSFLVSGYSLFAPNIRGSTGYGVEFQNLNIHDVGGGDLRDVEEAVKYLRSRPDVDPARIALVGASYGGYMTFLGLTKLSDYWAAGAAIVGITDWKEMYGLSDALFKSFIERYFGTPDENPALYHDRSPINFVDNLKAPLLIWHRGNDSRCPLKPVEKFAGRLKELGKTFEMNVVWDEGHGFQKTENLARQYKGVVSFLDKHLGEPSRPDQLF